MSSFLLLRDIQDIIPFVAGWYLMLQTLLGLFFGTLLTVGLVASTCCYFGRSRLGGSCTRNDTGSHREKENAATSVGACTVSAESERFAGKLFTYHQQPFAVTGKDSNARHSLSVHCSGSIAVSSKEDALLLDKDPDPDIIPIGTVFGRPSEHTCWLTTLT